MYVATDLHGHTLFSDARATPGEYVQFRHNLGMKVIAVSDHDLFAAVESAATVSEALGMILVPAAEVTSVLHFGTDQAEQVHILAYFPPETALDGRLQKSVLYQRGLRVQAAWKSFVLSWLEDLPQEDRQALNARGLAAMPAGQFPALQSMIDLVAYRRPTVYEAFRRHHVRFWHEDRGLFGWTPEELIDTIRADGALDIVAHPVRYHDKARLEQILAYASGVEVYTSRHAEKVAARFRAYAEAKDKYWTASSDDHQRGGYIRPPSGTPARTVERILGRAVPPEWLDAPSLG